jgi:hypothetical protein
VIIWDERSEEWLRLGLDSISECYINTIKGPALAKTLLAEGPPHIRFDFEKVVPTPQVLNGIEESNRSELGVCLMLLRAERGLTFEHIGLGEASIALVRKHVSMPDAPLYAAATAFLQKYPDYELSARKRFLALAETGYPGWHSWRIVHWGTRTNAFDFRVVGEDPFEFIFNTVQEFPWPIFETLTRDFPSLHFRCFTIEESGRFGGQGSFNPASDEPSFDYCEVTRDLQQKVFGPEYRESSTQRDRVPGSS